MLMTGVFNDHCSNIPPPLGCWIEGKKRRDAAEAKLSVKAFNKSFWSKLQLVDLSFLSLSHDVVLQLKRSLTAQPKPVLPSQYAPVCASATGDAAPL